jgi:hypothetical protein
MSANPSNLNVLITLMLFVSNVARAQDSIQAIMQEMAGRHRQNEQGLLAQQVQNQNNLIRNNWGLDRPSGQQQAPPPAQQTNQQQAPPPAQQTNQQQAPPPAQQTNQQQPATSNVNSNNNANANQPNSQNPPRMVPVMPGYNVAENLLGQVTNGRYSIPQTPAPTSGQQTGSQNSWFAKTNFPKGTPVQVISHKTIVGNKVLN